MSNDYISITKSAGRKVSLWCNAWQFILTESILHFYKSTIHLCIKYCCYIWSDASALYIGILDKIQRRIGNIICSDLASQLQLLSHCCNIASLCLVYKYFHGNYSDEFSTLVLWCHKFKHSTRLVVISLLKLLVLC